MTFDRNSALVKLWVNQVKSGNHTRDQIPNMFNLQEVVNEVLDEED